MTPKIKKISKLCHLGGQLAVLIHVDLLELGLHVAEVCVQVQLIHYEEQILQRT